MPYVPTYQKRANFLLSLSACQRTNVQKACQFFNLVCQCWWKSIHHVSWLRNYFAEAAVRRCSDEFRNIHMKPFYWSLFLNAFAGNFIESRLQYDCFPVNIVWFLITVFLREHLRCLVLYLRHYSTLKYSQKKRKET